MDQLVDCPDIMSIFSHFISNAAVQIDMNAKKANIEDFIYQMFLAFWIDEISRPATKA